MKTTIRMSLLVFVLALGSTAKADSIIDTYGVLALADCGGVSGCPAASYNFEITDTTAWLNVTIDGVPNASYNYITGVELGFAPADNLTSTPILFGVFYYPGDASTHVSHGWVTTVGNLGNSDCSANSSEVFICSSSLTGVMLVQHGIYTWIWTYAMNNVYDTSSVGDVHFGVKYGPNPGLIVSEEGATVPEPGSLLLLGTGWVAFIGFHRKK